MTNTPAGLPASPLAEFQAGGGSDRAATFVVAASGASTAWKATADYVCTGTNDNIAINAALAALPATGGTVMLSDGTFNISNPIIPTKNSSRLLGQGIDATVIRAATGANCNGFQYDQTQQAYNLIFCAIEGMTFNGNTNATGYGCYINYTLATHTFWDFYLRDVWFKNWGNDGFYSTGGHGYVLDHVLSEFNAGNGITFAGGFVDSPPRIVNGTIKINTGIGISVNVVDALVSGNEISNNSGTAGLVLSGSSCKATGNQVRTNTGHGIYVTGTAEGVEVSSNTVSSNGQHGIFVDAANNTIDNNFLNGNSTSVHGSFDEINVVRGTFNAIGQQIVGNIIDGASFTRYGINLAHSGDTGAVAAANRIINCLTAATNSLAPDTEWLGSGGLNTLVLARQATTGTTGFALQNATPNILSWTAPNDGALHSFTVYSIKHVTATETGGAVQVSYFSPFTGAVIHFSTLLAGGQATDTNGQPGTTISAICNPGTTVTVQQTSALTAGTSTVWVDLLGN